MKIKTSITLSEDLLDAVDKYSKPFKNRSEFIETATWKYVEQLIREKREARDLEIINRNSKRLNQEALDVLNYQVDV